MHVCSLHIYSMLAVRPACNVHLPHTSPICKYYIETPATRCTYHVTCHHRLYLISQSKSLQTNRYHMPGAQIHLYTPTWLHVCKFTSCSLHCVIKLATCQCWHWATTTDYTTYAIDEATSFAINMASIYTFGTFVLISK